MSAAPLARATDPVTSHLAAAEVEGSGARDAQQRQAARAVRDFPGHTSHELAQASGMDRYALARRLGEVEARGLIRRGDLRRCAVSGRLVLTWWPVGELEVSETCF